MENETIFSKLCDCVDALQTEVQRLRLCPRAYSLETVTLALEGIVDQLDCLIDDVVGLEVPALAEDPGPGKEPPCLS